MVHEEDLAMTDSYQIWTCPTCGAWRQHRECGNYLLPRCADSIHDWAVTKILVPEPPAGPGSGWVGENDTRLTLNQPEYEALQGILGYYLFRTAWVVALGRDERPSAVRARRELAQRLRSGSADPSPVPERLHDRNELVEASKAVDTGVKAELERVKAEFKEWRNWHVDAIVEGMGRWMRLADEARERGDRLEKDLTSSRRAADSFEEAYGLAAGRADSAEIALLKRSAEAIRLRQLLDRAEAQVQDQRAQLVQRAFFTADHKCKGPIRRWWAGIWSG